MLIHIKKKDRQRETSRQSSSADMEDEGFKRSPQRVAANTLVQFRYLNYVE